MLTVLAEASSIGEQCYVYATCGETQLNYLDTFPFPMKKGEISRGNIQWKYFPTRHDIQSSLLREIEDYDAILGINLFNPIWRDIYGAPSKMTRKGIPTLLAMLRRGNRPDHLDGNLQYNNVGPKIFGIEHSWNEIYNSRDGGIARGAQLFCNTQVSRRILLQLGAPPEQLESHGSPWLQLSDLFGRNVHKENLVTFLMPHNSWFEQTPGLVQYVSDLAASIKQICHEKGWQLILKTRSKYGADIDSSVFDEVVTDDNAFDHLDLYARSRIALHFCSSAVCELAFTRTCSITVLPSQNMRIHSRNRSLQRSKRLIHEQYYNPSDFLSCSPFATYVEDHTTIQEVIGYLMEQSSEDLDWEGFQQRFFPSDKPHYNAGKNILERMLELVAR